MSPRSTTTGASTDERASLRSGDGGAADSNLLRSIAGRTAGLSDNGAIERCRKFVDISFGTLVVRGRTYEDNAVRAGRRLEYRLHRAQYFRWLHDQHFQRKLHRTRTRHRPVDADLLAFLPRHVSD